MPFSPIPKLCVTSVFDITAEVLAEHGVSLLLLDLDNTLSTYSKTLPTDEILAWMQNLQSAGISLYIISNNPCQNRIENYAAACDIPCVHKARKPSTKSLLKAMEEMGKTPAETALMGDQVFTDGLAANRAGALSIVVVPLEFNNLFYKFRFQVERPFRYLGGNQRTAGPN